ncbi:transcription factor IIA, alpha/beta subunit [Thozetella sp. PMI_491]|nr:transcription factor IIA, alpha/beta subunit [Thozetella sp. PMI_491]
MSNTNVGSVYSQVINDVIEAVRVDFEESGVEESVLGDLTKKWQSKLSEMKLAQFPWEPKPDPPAAPTASAPPPQAHNNGSYTNATLSPPNNANSLSLPGMPPPSNIPVKAEPGPAKGDPVIKTEPGTANGQGLHAYPPNSNPQRMMAGPAADVAAARASLALQSQYGQRAAASISAIQSSIHPSVQQQQQQQQPGRPGQPAPQQIPANAQQYQRGMTQMMTAQAGQQPQQHNLANGLPQSQMDGANDFEGVLMQRNPEGNLVEMGRADIDNLIAEKIASRAKQMEGGGLMLPLREATRHRSIAKKTADSGPSQMDGDDDDVKDEEDDIDAINSDLDDPEEEQEDSDEEGDDLGDTMLCMYDKVQRVKNKWKCTLKDGVLTVNGKEYVFHKATGEYEW